MVDTNGLAGFFYLFVSNAFLTVNDVFLDRSLKEPGVLEDGTKSMTQKLIFRK